MKKITVFTTSTCSYCPMVKRYLQSKGLSYNEVNLEENPDRQQEVLAMSGALTVPVTLVEEEDKLPQIAVGYNLANLSQIVC